MSVRLLACCAVVGFALSGCKSEDPSAPDSLSVTPGGTVPAAAPVAFTATVTGGSGVRWTLTGPGSLSGEEGLHVTYRPPVPAPAGGTASLKATAGPNSVTVQLTLGPPPLTAKNIPGLSAPVTVLYDAWDVPHVRCAAAIDCYAVLGYLHARDRLFPMDLLRRTARGQVATLVGPLGLEQDVQLRTLFTMRDGGRIEDALATTVAADAGTAAVLNAYLAGVNARLAELTDATLPGEYAQLPVPVHATDIPDFTLKDAMALARLFEFQLSESLFAEASNGQFALAYGPGAPLFGTGGKLDTWLRAQQPVQARVYTLTGPAGLPAGLAAPGGAPPASALAPWAAGLSAFAGRMSALHDALHAQVGETGSNNWVVDAAHSATGRAMVANDPHLGLPYPPTFYLAALTSSNAADNLDVRGGAFPGIPVALVGRGRNVGWGVTVVGYDVTDLYQEQVVDAANGCPADAAHPFCVLTGTGLKRVIASPQSFQVRGPDGVLHDATAWPVGAPLLSAQESVVFVVPHHGPIVQAPDAAGKAISMRWTGHEGWTNELRGVLRLSRATDVDDAIEALKDFVVGAQNFVLADDAGHIAYDPHALVPIRDFADIRVVGANVKPPWFPLPGDGSADWGATADRAACAAVAAPRTCFLPDDQLPQGKDPAWGYFVTANSDPKGVSAQNNPLGQPPYLSFDWDEIGFRQARITQRLEEVKAAHAGKISQADMEAIQADHVSSLGKAFTDIVASPAYDAAAAAEPDFEAARDLLKGWGLTQPAYDCPTGLLGPDPVASADDPDATATANSTSCLLFHAFVRQLVHDVFADDLAVAGLGVSASNALKGMLHMLEPGVPADDTSFCKDVDAHGTVVASHTCPEQVVAALVTAYRTLVATSGDPAAGGWRWGRVHTFTTASQFPTVTLGYQAGPFARPGGALTVDVGNPSTTPGPSYAFGSSGNVRHVSVMDPTTPLARMQLPGPQRDGPYDVVSGPDLLGAWVRNTYFDYANWAQVQSTAVASQTFSP